jgi:Holliday junction resolvase RusA-like endonuclease
VRSSFSVLADPVPKPRMTRRDAWAKRPCVERYRQWCDEVRLAVTGSPAQKLDCDVLGVVAFFHLPVPGSWAEKKKAEHYGRLHRGSGDVDNFLKGLCDALFAEDKTIPVMQGYKFFVEDGEQSRTDVFLLVA